MPLSRRRFLKISLLSALGTASAGVGGFGYAHDIEPDLVEIVRINLTLPRLDPAFNGYQLAQISDIHIDTGMTKARLQRIVQMVNDLQPDAIAITGDYITGRWLLERSLEKLIEVLSELRAKDATVAVLGNHDHWTDADGVRRVLRESGLTELRNTVHTVKRGDAMLHLAGIDDYWERRDRLDEILGALPENGAAILLAHEPDYADISAATGRFDLQISGHSHGGQVIIPVLNRPVVIPTYGRKYPIGRYQVGTMIQYTNRGLGTVPPAVRFNCRPEITLFTLSGSTG